MDQHNQKPLDNKTVEKIKLVFENDFFTGFTASDNTFKQDVDGLISQLKAILFTVDYDSNDRLFKHEDFTTYCMLTDPRTESREQKKDHKNNIGYFEEQLQNIFNVQYKQGKSIDAQHATDEQIDLFWRLIDLKIFCDKCLNKTEYNFKGYHFPAFCKEKYQPFNFLETDKRIFDKPTIFLMCHFWSDVDFKNCIFSDKVSFNLAHFHDKTYFNSARFDGEAYFRKTYFHADTDFEACFFGNATFDEITFPSANILRFRPLFFYIILAILSILAIVFNIDDFFIMLNNSDVLTFLIEVLLVGGLCALITVTSGWLLLYFRIYVLKRQKKRSSFFLNRLFLFLLKKLSFITEFIFHTCAKLHGLLYRLLNYSLSPLLKKVTLSAKHRTELYNLIIFHSIVICISVAFAFSFDIVAYLSTDSVFEAMALLMMTITLSYILYAVLQYLEILSEFEEQTIHMVRVTMEQLIWSEFTHALDVQRIDTNRETLASLKESNNSKGNFIDANLFFASESDSYLTKTWQKLITLPVTDDRDEDCNNKPPKTFGGRLGLLPDVISFSIAKYTNNYGTNWVLPLFSAFIIILSLNNVFKVNVDFRATSSTPSFLLVDCHERDNKSTSLCIQKKIEEKALAMNPKAEEIYNFEFYESNPRYALKENTIVSLSYLMNSAYPDFITQDKWFVTVANQEKTILKVFISIILIYFLGAFTFALRNRTKRD